VESFGLLRDYGIPVAPTLAADTAASAQAAARRIGWPAALKTAAAGIAHKSDMGGVRLGIADPTTPGPPAAWQRMRWWHLAGNDNLAAFTLCGSLGG